MKKAIFAILGVVALLGVGRLVTPDAPKKRGDFINSNGFVQGARSVVAGPGVTVQGSTVSINPTYTQRRVSQICAGGNAISAVAQDGTVTCSSNAGAGVSSVSGGTGVTITNPTTTPNIALDSTIWQSRVSGAAASHNAITAVAANGTVSSAAFLDTPGTGLASSGAGDVHLNITGASCSAGQQVSAISATGTGTCSADVTAVANGTGITTSTVSGTATITANLAGGTCSNGQALTSLSATGTGTCGNAVSNSYGGTHMEWSDEFMWSQAAANGTIPDGWLGTNISGTGAAISGSVTGTTTRPGIVDIATGTTTTGRAALNTGNQFIDLGSGLWDYTQVGGFATLSNSTDGYAALIGFFDVSNAVDQTDGCYFLYDERQTASAPATGSRPAAASNSLACVCSIGAVRTEYPMDGTVSDSSFTTIAQTVAALTLPSTNILNLEVQEVSSSEVDFLVNGTKSCVITTHIPTGVTRLTGAGTLIIKSVGTTSRTMDVDRAQLKVDLTSARTP